jgi:hypothetical protein
MPDINLNPYTAESQAIAQRMRMAELLNQQAMQPLEMPQVAGARISPYAGLAKILQGYTAGVGQRKALEQQQALGEKYQAGNQADIANFLGAMQGTPQKELAGPAPEGAPTGISPEGMQGGYIQPAQAPDRQRAMALALGSQNPTLQSAGGHILSQMMTPKQPIHVPAGGTILDPTTLQPVYTAPKDRTGELAVYDEYVKQQTALGKKPLGINEFQIEQRKASRPLAPPRERVVFDATRGGTVNLDTGAFTPVTQNGEPIGTKPKDLRPVPATINTAMTQNQAVLNKLDRVDQLLAANPNATGILKGITPNVILNRTDKEGIAARAALAELAATKVHDLSGAAVSVSEFGRLKPFLPQPTDDAETIKTKLAGMRAEIQDIMGATNQIYSEEQGYKPIPNLAPPKPDTPPLDRLKEGQVTKFANGQEWTLQGGKPKQVK